MWRPVLLIVALMLSAGSAESGGGTQHGWAALASIANDVSKSHSSAPSPPRMACFVVRASPAEQPATRCYTGRDRCQLARWLADGLGPAAIDYVCSWKD